jgi:hypothetical protein
MVASHVTCRRRLVQIHFALFPHRSEQACDHHQVFASSPHQQTTHAWYCGPFVHVKTLSDDYGVANAVLYAGREHFFMERRAGRFPRFHALVGLAALLERVVSTE